MSHPPRSCLLIAVAVTALVGGGCASDPEPLTRADEPKLVELCVGMVENEDFCNEEVEELGIVARVKGCTYDETAEFLRALLGPLGETPPDRAEVTRLSDLFNEDCSI